MKRNRTHQVTMHTRHHHGLNGVSISKAKYYRDAEIVQCGILVAFLRSLSANVV